MLWLTVAYIKYCSYDRLYLSQKIMAMSKWLTNYMFTGGYPLKPRISKRLMWAIIYLQPSRNPPVIAVVLNGIFLLVYGDLDIFYGPWKCCLFFGEILLIFVWIILRERYFCVFCRFKVILKKVSINFYFTRFVSMINCFSTPLVNISLVGTGWP